MNKFPIDWQTGHVADAHDRALWLPFERAASASAILGPDHGVGFVFSPGDPFWFLDLDNCRTTDGWSELATLTTTALAGCAVELSHSGRGLHVFGTGQLPPHGCKNIARGMELYHEGRFVALGSGATGNAGHNPGDAALQWLVGNFFPVNGGAAAAPDDWRDGPAPGWAGPSDDDEIIRRMLAARQGAGSVFGTRATAVQLWNAEPEALGRAFPDSGNRAYDASSADAALAGHLAFWTGNDHARIERLMRRSALAREKWDTHGSYLRRTILRSPSTNVYCDPRAARASVVSATDVAPDMAGLTIPAASGGSLTASLENVIDEVLRNRETFRPQYDTFRDDVFIAAGAERLTRRHYIALREQYGRGGFKPVGADVMRDAVYKVATDPENRFDSLAVWAAGLQWDGVPRVDTCMLEYFGCSDTPYSRAIGSYLWTALAGRALEPGCKADMALILVDKQGTLKTSAVAALAPWPETFGEFDLADIGTPDASRRLLGKCVIELSELKGLSTRDDESIKSWVTRPWEEWRRLYEEGMTRYYRRCVLIGTSNRDDLLTDPTGNRRWLPTRTGTIALDALRTDCGQLWAEGVARWRANGVEWEAAESLAIDQHGEFASHDAWHDRIASWVDAAPPQTPADAVPLPPRWAAGFTAEEVMAGALQLPATAMDRRNRNRVCAVLRALGLENTLRRTADGGAQRRWRR